MNIDQQVTSLELSRRLKELGLKQESYFNYALNGMACGYDCPNETHNDPAHLFCLNESWKIEENNGVYTPCYSAYTVAELFEIIPAWICTKEKIFNNYRLNLSKQTALNIQWIVSYCCDSYATDESAAHYGVNPFTTKVHTDSKQFDESLANCLAKLLIYLIENNLMTDEWRAQWLEK